MVAIEHSSNLNDVIKIQIEGKIKYSTVRIYLQKYY